MALKEPLWPALTLFAVTPSDATVFTSEVRRLYVGGAGDVSVTTTDGVTVVFKAVPVGTTIGPFFINKVNATGTTATNIVAMV